MGSYMSLSYFRVENQNTPKEKKTYILSSEEKQRLQNGDIIFRKGRGYVSDVINDMFNTGYQISHCGMVLRNGDSLQVIHTVSSELSNTDGIQAQPLEQFVRESVQNSIVVTRYKADDSIRNMLAKAAYRYKNTNKKFDHRFDLSDTTEFYCTEYIHYAFMDVFGKDMFTERLETDHPNFLSLNAFLDSTKFEVILQHQKRKPDVSYAK